jgi:hypothetical protein
MNTRADGARVACPLFHAGDGGSTPTSALQLRLYRVRHGEARALNRLWHSRLPRVGAGSRACYAAEFDGLYYAVAIWSRPVARLLPQWEWLELQRLAIAPDAPKNTASRLLGVMARLIRRDFPRVVRLVSYQDVDVHTGAIYKAAGWTMTKKVRFADWNHKTRHCRAAQTTADKQRWEKSLS